MPDGMTLIHRPALARRLRAIVDELEITPAMLAKELKMERTRVANWFTENPAKPSRPDEEAMAHLVTRLHGLTLDYIYLGRVDCLPTWLAIRLTARERGEVPPADTDHRQALASLAIDASRLRQAT